MTTHLLQASLDEATAQEARTLFASAHCAEDRTRPGAAVAAAYRTETQQAIDHLELTDDEREEARDRYEAVFARTWDRLRAHLDAQSTLRSASERATNILVGEAPGDEASAHAFAGWLQEFLVGHSVFDIWLNRWAEEWGHLYRSAADAWDTIYYYGPEATLIREQSGDCYVVPNERTHTMPVVIGGERSTETEEDDGDGE